MGIDNRERRACNWWNMFQVVYWNKLEKDVKARGDEGDRDGALTSGELEGFMP
jgi:hypothetical protein